MRVGIKRFCLNSATVAWSYFVAIAGAVLQIIDAAADVLGDPSIKDSMNSALGGDPKTLGKILLAVSLITIIARVRSIRKGA